MLPDKQQKTKPYKGAALSISCQTAQLREFFAFCCFKIKSTNHFWGTIKCVINMEGTGSV